MLMPVIILGGIYSGIFTATESAAIAVVYALLVEMAIYRKLDWRGVATVSVETVKLLGGLFPVLMMALSINRLLIYEQVPAQIAAALGGMFGDPSSFMASSNLLLLLVGCLLDIGSAILVFAPILQPIAEVHGINAVHFGIIMTVNLEIGYLTPPMGLNIIVAMTAFRENFWFVCRSVLPFIGALLVGLIIVVLWPALSLFLL
jgi:C4-dicarboxylate transporter DctM subunit